MNFIYKYFIKPFLFKLDAETAHLKVLHFLKWFWSKPFFRNCSKKYFQNQITVKPVRICATLIFKNPIGLAAGFDKNAELIHGIDTLGFGFVEVGTVTPLPQEGNPKPRIHRELDREAIVNRMGFPNDGALVIAERIRENKKYCEVPIGINIGKNKNTPNTEAISDYIKCIKEFNEIADYFAINLSSPNTPGLRDLQSSTFLRKLETEIINLKIYKPILIKLAPELATEDLKEITQFISPNKVFNGLILTNTIASDLGGISGRPLRDLSFQTLKRARGFLNPACPIISVGGIFDYQDVSERLQNGAQAVQIYTSLIYKGPNLVRNLLIKINSSYKIYSN